MSFISFSLIYITSIYLMKKKKEKKMKRKNRAAQPHKTPLLFLPHIFTLLPKQSAPPQPQIQPPCHQCPQPHTICSSQLHEWRWFHTLKENCLQNFDFISIRTGVLKLLWFFRKLIFEFVWGVKKNAFEKLFFELYRTGSKNNFWNLEWCSKTYFELGRRTRNF